MFIKLGSECREIRGFEFRRVDGSVISLKAFMSDLKSDVKLDCIRRKVNMFGR